MVDAKGEPEKKERKEKGRQLNDSKRFHAGGLWESAVAAVAFASVVL